MQVPAPPTVRAAGVIVGLQGLAGVAFAVAVLVRAFGGASTPGDNLYAEAGYFAVLGGLILATGIGLIIGKRWSRTPAIVIQLILLGASWYALGPSRRPEFGIPAAVICIAVLVLLLNARSRSWALREDEAEPPDDRKRRP